MAARINYRRLLGLALCSILALLMLLVGASRDLALCIDKGRFMTMEDIAEGIIHYNDSHGRLPRSLAELSSDRFLPERSEIYACPVQSGRFFSLPVVEFTNMQYEIVF